MRFPTRFQNTDAARVQHGDRRVNQLGEALGRVDPLADDVVRLFGERPRGEGWRLFNRALSGEAPRSSLPAALRAFFDAAHEVPFWLEEAVLERGGDALYRGAILSGLVLALKSLVYGYASPGGNKPLVFAGGLVERAPRRLNETSRFVHAVCSPGGMRVGQPGWSITLKVRVMHAQVRALILRSGRWDADAWGAPVNQHDMLATTQLFSTSLLHGLEQCGFHFDAEEAERYMMLWRYTGELMGVEPELLATSYAQGMRLSELILGTQGPPDEDSRALTRALLSARLVGVTGEAERQTLERRLRVVRGLCRGLLGDELADALELPDNAWKHTLTAIHAVVSRAEALRRRVPGGNAMAVALGRRHWERSVEIGLAGVPATYTPPTRLEGAPR